MPRFVRRLVFWISLCCPALCLAQGEAESTAQSVAKMLPSLWTAKEMDDKCNVLSAREKQALRDSISAMARSINLNEETLRKRMAETDPVGRLSCGDELAGQLLGLAKNVSKTWIARTSPQEDPKPGSWAHVQQSWAQIFNEKPRGRLGIFEGCWSGKVDSHATEVCFLERGDLIKFRLGSPGALSCSFRDGGARENGGYAMFFAAAEKPTCSDGSRIQHVEGGCKPISNSEIECIVSNFSLDNRVNETRAGSAVSDTVRLKRR